ncbi:hypothetical protein G7Y89_g2099 [Cudoniella acicularis]|uniref:Uncharacterized protein n=1 Tax=Cudoniella acicularis TaxID=354080 RepID=A0A8H4W7A0_9HELO|nr:hypothetical protein G7Y89_g2099 [Cudoniella acicularis]
MNIMSLNRSLRKILGVFKTTPIIPIELESALPPPNIRLNNSIRRYAFRAPKLPPTHPIPAKITKSRLRDDKIDIIKALPDIIEAPLDILEEDELSISQYHQPADLTNHEPDITRAVKRLNTTRDQNLKNLTDSTEIVVQTPFLEELALRHVTIEDQTIEDPPTNQRGENREPANQNQEAKTTKTPPTYVNRTYL